MSRVGGIIDNLRAVADKVETAVKLLQWVVDSLRNLPKL